LTPLGINATGNLTITFAGFNHILITNLTNKHYWDIFSGCQVCLNQCVYISNLEIVGNIHQTILLMIRLYANIFAGHIVLMSIIGLMFILKVG
jgi:F-type H+-transporting ATPase subunit a